MPPPSTSIPGHASAKLSLREVVYIPFIVTWKRFCSTLPYIDTWIRLYTPLASIPGHASAELRVKETVYTPYIHTWTRHWSTLP